jgi:hypothetical protein
MTALLSMNGFASAILPKKSVPSFYAIASAIIDSPPINISSLGSTTSPDKLVSINVIVSRTCLPIV